MVAIGLFADAMLATGIAADLGTRWLPLRLGAVVAGVGLVRTLIEASAVAIGWALGGSASRAGCTGPTAPSSSPNPTGTS
jgi:hypothetical protein